jgi:type VI secretion system protein ImpH
VEKLETEAAQPAFRAGGAHRQNHVRAALRLDGAELVAAYDPRPEALAKVLWQYFGVVARVEPHVGHWLSIDPVDRSRLGFARNRSERSEHSENAAPQLGQSTNAGSRVWDRQYRFRLHLGPLDMAQYLAFLPSGSAWPALQAWVRLLAGRELQWDLQLTLTGSARPEARLGRNVRLGVLGWLGTRPDRGRSLRLRPLTSFLTHRPGALE